MRLKPRFILPLLILMLMISYQNFSNVSSNEWDSADTLKIMNEMSEFEKNNPSKPVIATPQGGSDLKSVSNDWMERQGSILLNGYDKRLESAMNEKLNSWVQDISTDASAASADAVATSEPVPEPGADTSRKTKNNFRFARLNALKYDIGESTCLDLTADPGNTRLNYSQTLSSNTKLGVEHRTSDNKTQML
ncbi:MAG: hypothetical protein H7326_05290, partial [Bdellovibrionaceae bacterium]|nr:hypothetical protein [Pseudobdellovibrionaceae bacterium]